MAIPENKLSSINLPAPLVEPKGFNPDSLISEYERGGIAIEDASEGMDYQDWQVTINGQDIVVTGQTTLESVIVFTAIGIVTEVSLAFDQLMHIFITFVEDDIAQFYWYNPISEANEFFILPANTISPRCTLDDHRYTQVPASDIIIAYTTNNNLCFRMQRDRYTIEYLLTTGITRLKRIGMGTNNRLQFMFENVI